MLIYFFKKWIRKPEVGVNLSVTFCSVLKHFQIQTKNTKEAAVAVSIETGEVHAFENVLVK